MAFGRAEKSFIGVGVQSVLGTVVTRTKFVDIISEGLQRRQTRKESGVLGSTSARAVTELSRWADGPLELEGNYEGMEIFFKHGLGTCNTTNVSGTAYNHVMTLADSLPTPGLTIEVNRDITAFLYSDCKVDKLELNQGAEDYLRIRVDMMGRIESQVSASTPSFPADKRIATPDMTFSANAVPLSIGSFRMLMENTMDHRPQISSIDRKEVLRVGRRRVTGSFELDFEDVVQYNLFVAQTHVPILATWTGPTITGGEHYRLVASMPSCYFSGVDIPINRPGPIIQTINYTACEQSRGAGDELTITLESTATSVP